MKLYHQISVKLADASFKSILESFSAHDVMEDLCAMAESTFSSKINPKLISSAAAKCHIAKAEMQSLIDCLALLLDTWARLGSEPKEVEECLVLCGAGPAAAAAIASHGAACQARLRDRLAAQIAASTTATTQRLSAAPAFHSLRWRFDVEVASRCLGDQIVPLVKLQLVTAGSTGTLESHWLQTDPNNLRHLVESLEAALTASQTNHAQRVMRYVK